jgi:glycosyltransferase involved in cell wall biosynthesis
MRVSGFTFVRDAVRLDFPVREAITSILPICDEFVVNVGRSDDGTLELVRGIGSPKLVVFESTWDPALFVRGAINARQTNLALDRCTGDWCFYLQADEVVHEADHERIVRSMEQALPRREVEGLLFRYYHFWGDYDRYHTSHGWYDRDIRIVRNGVGIRSWKSAQSFRLSDRKLRVVDCGAYIYHYGWVRHPAVMKRKQIALDSLHHGRAWVESKHPEPEEPFDYGPLDRLGRFRGSHPAVMRERIASKSWDAHQFRRSDREKHKHERLGVRVLSWLENRIVGRRIGGYSNWVLIR